MWADRVLFAIWSDNISGLSLTQAHPGPQITDVGTNMPRLVAIWYNYPMDFSGGGIITALFVGTIGLAVFVYGKKQSLILHMAAGTILMIFPYFVSNAWATIGIAAAILAGLFVLSRIVG